MRSSRPSAPGLAAAPAGLVEGANRGAVAASNAAAAASNAAFPTEAASPGAPPRGPRPLRPSADARPRDPIELVWLDPGAAPRVRAATAFREVFGSRSEPASWIKGDEAPRETQEVRDRRDVVRALTRGRALDPAGLSQAIEGAIDDEGVLSPPMVLASGELTFTFDEYETLKATITVVSPFIGTDKKLRDTVTSATELLKAEWRPPGDVADGFTARVKEAFTQASRALTPSYLQSSVDALLLEGRHYQRKTLLGELRIRALFEVSGGGSPIPAYLPEAQAKQLPLFKQLRARVLAELRLRQDQKEACPEALFLVALGRAVRDARPSS